jgi:hypothetical protein
MRIVADQSGSLLVSSALHREATNAKYKDRFIGTVSIVTNRESSRGCI